MLQVRENEVSLRKWSCGTAQLLTSKSFCSAHFGIFCSLLFYRAKVHIWTECFCNEGNKYSRRRL